LNHITLATILDALLLLARKYLACHQHLWLDNFGSMWGFHIGRSCLDLLQTSPQNGSNLNILAGLPNCSIVIEFANKQDTIPVQPVMFSLPPLVALQAEINKKYANRVVFDVGLVICLFDFLKVGEGIVQYGDGCYWYKGVFVLLVHRFISNGGDLFFLWGP
jgi:hypothetical protein